MIMARGDGYLCIICIVYLKEWSAGKIMLHLKKKATFLSKKRDNYKYPEVEENMSLRRFATFAFESLHCPQKNFMVDIVGSRLT